RVCKLGRRRDGHNVRPVVPCYAYAGDDGRVTRGQPVRGGCGDGDGVSRLDRGGDVHRIITVHREDLRLTRAGTGGAQVNHADVGIHVVNHQRFVRARV